MPADLSRRPETFAYFEGQGMTPHGNGKGKWRTFGPCLFHSPGGTDSTRINIESGAGICMACGVKWGDVIGHYMLHHGVEFVDACKALGCWIESDRPSKYPLKALPFSARNALEVIRFECLLVAVAACNLAKGIELASADRERLVQAAARIQFIAEEVGK